LSETVTWLLYFVSGGLAFAAVRYKRWPITLSMLAAAAATTLIWYVAVQLRKEENEPSWITVETALNASFALIFAGAGAALAMCLRMRDER